MNGPKSRLRLKLSDCHSTFLPRPVPSVFLRLKSQTYLSDVGFGLAEPHSQQLGSLDRDEVGLAWSRERRREE